MELSTILLTLFITLLCILPFFLFTYMGRKGSIESKKRINNLVKTEQLDFNEKEYWRNNFIGIDINKNQVLFIKVKPNGDEIIKIDLRDIKSCQIHKSTRDYKREKKVESELQKMDLEFMLDSKQPNVILNFYDIQDHLSEDFEMKRAEKWKNLILNNIKKTAVNAA